jgi:hypothetical protein
VCEAASVKKKGKKERKNCLGPSYHREEKKEITNKQWKK